MHAERAALQPCDRCGNFGCAECLAPAGGQQQCTACRARGSELEWDRRTEHGLFRAWWLTTRRMMVAPIQTLDVISPDGSIVESSIYASISTLAGFLPTLLLYGVGMFAALAFGAFEDSKVTFAAGTGIGLVAFVFYLALLMVMSVGFMLLSAGLEWIVLRLAGKPDASYSVSVRAHALSMAAYAVGVVPLCSVYVFPIWSLVLRCFAIHKLHRTTAGLGVASALIPLALCCGLGTIFYGAIIALAALGAKS